MALFKYFKKSSLLPNPEGPLSDRMPSKAILSANREVESLVMTEDCPVMPPKKRGAYLNYTDEEKARIAKRAAEFGETNTLKHLSKEYEDWPLKESTVRTWMLKYKKELASRVKKGEDTSITALKGKKRGHPYLLGEDMDRQLQAYIKSLRESKAIINSAIVVSAAEGIIKSHDSSLLECNRGHIKCTKHWAKHFLSRIGYVKRKATTKASISDIDFEAQKDQFLFDIRAIIEIEDIPKELVINWDHTGIQYIPVSNWTMAKEGFKRIEVAGLGDKRQLTTVFAASMSGDFLPPQIIYAGKTPRCFPSTKFPNDWNITYTENHWANEKTTVLHIKKILVPYIEACRKKLSLPDNQAALVIFDKFKGQCTSNILSLLQSNHIHLVIVPSNCTDRLQPLDVSVNKAVKENLRKQFQEWYSAQVSKNMDTPGSPIVDLSMAVVKPLGAAWIMNTFQYIKSNPTIIVNGFQHAGIKFND
uniref:DDE-1 domain-containing protein n=1 Tax=Amphimedon queenslandica TaxID=400682 RepID=A0A1X7SY85_AMPQE